MTVDRYVLGFLFDAAFESVVLIKKNKPAWQKGRFNGVGGKIEDNESSNDAMMREFEEEAGLRLETWRYFLHLSGTGFEVCCYYTTAPSLLAIKSVTDEAVVIVSVEDVLRRSMPSIGNIPWLVAMARAVGTSDDSCTLFEVKELEWH